MNNELKPLAIMELINANCSKSVRFDILFVVILFLTGQKALSQNDSYIPPSPTVAGLAEFVDIPVGNYTGVPESCIPLYQFNAGKVSVDLAISYHAIGNKVDEIPGYLGLGWSLQAGGIISRERRGWSSDGFEHRFDNPAFYDTCCIGVSVCDNPVCTGWAMRFIDWYNETADAEPDIFTYNFNGYTGKFYFDYKGNAVMLEASDIKVKMKTGDIIEMTMPDGLVYTFGESNYKERNGTIVTGYFLTSIKDHLENILVNFVYEEERIGDLNAGHRSVIYLTGNGTLIYSHITPGVGVVHNMSYTVNTHRIKRIYNDTGEIIFNYEVFREDIRLNTASPAPAKALKDITIRNANEMIRKVVFHTSYFIVPGIEEVALDEQYHYKRLRLDSLSIQSAANEVSEKYSFEYNPEPLPPRTSLCRDYWGFYNGKLPNGQYKNDALGHMIPNVSDELIHWKDQWRYDGSG